MKKYTLILRLALAMLVGPISSVYAQSTTTDDSNITPQEIATRQAYLRAYFQNRRNELHIVATKTLPNGQVVDFVPAEANPPTPPPPPPNAVAPPTWLQRNPALQGPPGTVPVARFDIEAYLQNVKVPPKDVSHMFQPPHNGVFNGATYFYYVKAFAYPDANQGSFATFNSWMAPGPTVNGGHILAQIDLAGTSLASNGNYLNTIELGYTQDPNLNHGTSIPLLFVYFTTNGYASEGDDVGGYNVVHAGFHQLSNAVYPGLYDVPLSTYGGGQGQASMVARYNNGDWFIYYGTTLVGYYPASLFVASPGGLATESTNNGCHGEVCTGNMDKVDANGMGSGHAVVVGDDGPQNFTHAAYIRDFGEINGNNFVSYQDPAGGGSGPFLETPIVPTDSGCYGVSGPFFSQDSPPPSGVTQNDPALYNFWYYGGPGSPNGSGGTGTCQP